MKLRVVGALVVALAVLTGCSENHKAGTPADVRQPTTTTTVLPTTTTPTAVDPGKVPVTIDAAYAQAVMDRLDQSLGDAWRTFAKTKLPSPEFYDQLKAIYGPKAFEAMVTMYGRASAQYPEEVRTTPGNPSTRVDGLLGSSSTCMYFTVYRDFNAFWLTPSTSERRPTFVQLLRKNPGQDPARRNPTQ